MARSVVFIDPRVEAACLLADALPEGAEPIELAPHGDAMRQIAAHLAGRGGIGAVHLVCHGSAGALELGDTVVDAQSLDRHALAIDTIGRSLASGGELLLYACELAAGDTGRAFVAQLAARLGKAVAASSRPYGASWLGGQSDLDVRIGESATSPLFAASTLDRAGVLLGTLPASLDTSQLPGSRLILNPAGDTAAVNILSSPLDVSLYAFQQDAAGSNTFTLQGGGFDGQFRIYLANGQPLSAVINSAGSGGTDITTLSLDAGQWYYAAVTGVGSSTGGFTFSIDGPPVTPSVISLSAPSQIGSTGSNFSFTPGGDVDHFMVVAPAGSTGLDVSISAAAGVNPVIQVRNSPSGGPLVEINESTGVTESRNNIAVVGGATYYVSVYNANRSTTGAYTLLVDFNPDGTSLGDPPASLDNEILTALRLVPDPNGDMSAVDTIALAAEYDVWAFQQDVSGNNTISVQGSGFNGQLRVYDAGGLPITGIVDNAGVGGSDVLAVSLNAGQWYYVAVGGAQTNTGIYTLSVNGPSTVLTSLTLPSPTWSTQVGGQSISPAGDADYYALVAPPGTSSLNLSVSATAGLDPVVLVRDNAGAAPFVQMNDSSGTGEGRSGIPVVGGATYFVTVYGANRSGSGSFTLAADFNRDNADFGDPPPNLQPTPTTGTRLIANPSGDARIAGRIASPTQVDLVAFQAETSGLTAFALRGAGFDGQLRVYDSLGNALTAVINTAGAGGIDTATLDLTAGQLYYVAVAGFQATTGDYELIIDGPAPESVPVPIVAPTFTGSTRNEAFSPAGDVDYFTVVAPPGTTTLNLSVIGTPGADPVIELRGSPVDAAPGILADESTGVIESRGQIPVVGGATYYVSVYDAKRTASSSYTLTADFDPDVAPDNRPPAIATFDPADEAVRVHVGSSIVLTFDEPVQRGSGTVELRDASGAVFASWAASVASQLIYSGNTLTIDPSTDLAPGTEYRISIDAGVVKDLVGNVWPGTTSYNFTTAAVNTPTIGPDVLTGTPFDDVIDALAGNDVINALGGNDTLTGGPGVDRIDGGPGIDTAVFGGARSDYLLSRRSDGVVTVADRFGVMDTLSNVETLRIGAEAIATATLGYLPDVTLPPAEVPSLVYRFYNVRDRAFFYTASAPERDMVIRESTDPSYTPENGIWPYFYQGSTFEQAHSSSGAVPVYRFYNRVTGHHFFTVSEDERLMVIRESTDPSFTPQNGLWPFNDEGVGFFAFSSAGHPDAAAVFRFYSPTLDRHFFTANPDEAAQVRLTGVWNDEGVGFYGEIAG